MQETYDLQGRATTHPLQTILVVEDDLHVGYVLAQALKEEASYRVIFATDAVQALKMIRVALPDLIVSDYHLPQMDGLAFIEYLRASNESEHIPVILISGNRPAHVPMNNKVTYLKKPFELDDLLQQVACLLASSTPT